MEVLEVTNKQFRAKKKTFFDMADAGKQIIIRRGINEQAYTLAPVNDADLYFTPEMEAKIERAMKQIENGECTVITNDEELHQFFENL
jgi:hypothetical protein